jgi:Trk-type K+ transport system membrane component
MTIGNLKYKVQFNLFEEIQKSSKAALIDFPEAYTFALLLFLYLKNRRSLQAVNHQLG